MMTNSKLKNKIKRKYFKRRIKNKIFFLKKKLKYMNNEPP